MKTARVTYVGHDLCLTLLPATEENAAYTEYLGQVASTHQLALTFDRFSEEAALKVLADVYVQTVVADYGRLDQNSCEKWFLDHLAEFEQTIYVAENPDKWEEMSHGSRQHEL